MFRDYSSNTRTLPVPATGGGARHAHVIFTDSVLHRRRPVNLGPASPAAKIDKLSSDECELIGWMFRESGLNASLYRKQSLARRMPACLRILRAESAATAHQTLLANRALLPTALSSLVIGVTGFFRDPSVFQTLRQRILPELLKKNDHLAIWSAGCSTGQEMYSLAMILSEIDALSRVKLFGTDCRSEAIRQAMSGIYSEHDVRGLPVHLLNQHFVPAVGAWQITTPLRAATRWCTADNAKFTSPDRWNIILCRNMVMYLEAGPAGKLWSRLYGALRPGGVLVVGKAERPEIDGLRPVAPCIFQKT